MKRQIILVMTAALFLAGCGRAAEPVVIVPRMRRRASLLSLRDRKIRRTQQ